MIDDLNPAAYIGGVKQRKGKNDVSGPSSTDSPANAMIGEIIRSMPHLTAPRWSAALLQLLLTVGVAIVATYLIAILPWYLLPFAWCMQGLSLCSLYLIGQDCANGKFSPSNVFNKLIGEIACLPLLRPFESFRYNLIALKDKAHAAVVEAAATASAAVAPVVSGEDGTTKETIFKSLRDKAGYLRGSEQFGQYLWLSVRTFVKENFAPTIPACQKNAIRASVIICILYIATMIPTLSWFGGYFGIVKFWILPLIAYRLLFTPLYDIFTHRVGAYIETSYIPSYNLRSVSAIVATKIDIAKVDAQTMVAGIKQFIGRLHIIHCVILFGVPIVGFGALYYGVPIQRATLIWSFWYYLVTGLGITAGYHRLFAHRAYQGHWVTRWCLMLAGSGALQGSIKWWCGGHRIHHRYTDTPKDPYNSNGGFWYAHIGWMLVKPDPANQAYADIRDLRADPMCQFQHKYYFFVGPFMALVFPTLVAGLGWGDWLGGYCYAGALRLFCVHHSTFCVNSVAHWFGELTFDDDRTPRDSVVTALLTFGEGYHNFHHEFPNDYRNAIKWYQYDPTKWLIKTLNILGLANNLKTFSENEIMKGMVYMKEKKLREQKEQVIYPPHLKDLEILTWPQIKQRCEAGEQLIVVGGIVHNAASFINEHPGGDAIVKAAVGVDATDRFNGYTGVYKHSHAAHNLLETLRVGRLAFSEKGALSEQQVQANYKAY